MGRAQKPSSPTMMRIAIAGGGGLAYILAQQLSQTAHAVLVLTRRPHPEFEQEGSECQVAVVDYNNITELRYTLQGIDIVISTIGNSEQLNLIDAARWARVKVFIPSEFEGALNHRPPATNDPLDRGTAAVMEQLQRWSQSKSYRMEYTVISCGIFYERFAPGGLQAYNIGAGSGVQFPNDYLVDVEHASAEIIETNAQGQPVQISMTSVYDVARFLAAAIENDISQWPREIKMRGDQMSVRDVVGHCSIVRSVPFNLSTRTTAEMQAQATEAYETSDWRRWQYAQRLIATADGRYNFRSPNLGQVLGTANDVARPIRFREWLERVWGPAT